jgi:hypothetical protein
MLDAEHAGQRVQQHAVTQRCWVRRLQEVRCYDAFAGCIKEQ